MMMNNMQSKEQLLKFPSYEPSKISVKAKESLVSQLENSKISFDPEEISQLTTVLEALDIITTVLEALDIIVNGTQPFYPIDKDVEPINQTTIEKNIQGNRTLATVLKAIKEKETQVIDLNNVFRKSIIDISQKVVGTIHSDSPAKILKEAPKKLDVFQTELERIKAAKKAFQDFNDSLKKLSKEQEALQNEYKKLEAAGVKIVKTEERKFLQEIIKTAILAQMNSQELNYQQFAIQRKDNTKLTDAQIRELVAIGKAFAVEPNRESRLSQNIEGLKDAVETEVNKGLSAQVWRDVKAIPETVERQYANWKGIKNGASALDKEANFKFANSAIELQYKENKFSFKLKEDVELTPEQKNIAEQLLSNANNRLNTLRQSKNFNLESKFNIMLHGIETSTKVQNLWQKIVETIKHFSEKKFGIKFNKSVDNLLDLSNKQNRSAKAVPLDKFSKQLQKESKEPQQVRSM